MVAWVAVLWGSGCGAAKPECAVVSVRPNEVRVRASVPVTVHLGESPMFGVMAMDHGYHVFRPSFPFTPGLDYEARADECVVRFSLPAASVPPADILHIRPRAPELPANTLRFYVSFSVPMAEGAGLSHVRLEDLDAGAEVTGVFFDARQELWSADRRRVTLLLDPGRVKSGLQAHTMLGRALQAGRRYRLHVLASWPTLDGRPIARSVHHDFRVTEPTMVALQPESWRAARLGEHMVLDFGHPVDHVSVGRYLALVQASGAVVPGTWTLHDEAQRGSFTPLDEWPAGELALRVHQRFEDVAGNTVDAAFDHAVGDVSPADPVWRDVPLSALAPLTPVEDVP